MLLLDDSVVPILTLENRSLFPFYISMPNNALIRSSCISGSFGNIFKDGRAEGVDVD